jgi:AcrR family transcriptional regulator
MDKLEFYSFGGMTNSSDAMFERRRRIVDEARKIIGHEGLDGFNIRKLCKRADVAQRTIYNAFGSKENVMALAIRQHFDSFESRIKFSSDPSSLEGVLEHQITTTLRSLEIPNYLRAVASLYFSPTIHPRIRSVLVEVGGRPYVSWLRLLVLQRQIEKGVEIDNLLIDLSNAQYAKVHEWGIGALSEKLFVDLTLQSVLILLAGAVRGAARTEVGAAFADFAAEGALKKRLISEARSRIKIIHRG